MWWLGSFGRGIPVILVHAERGSQIQICAKTKGDDPKRAVFVCSRLDERLSCSQHDTTRSKQHSSRR